jgi:L-glutamine:2-deoxy-scyllo-inosose/3-amino-2,3-dideoxy-scyllo-inosose aminotransferase
MPKNLALFGGEPVVRIPVVWPERGRREQELLEEVLSRGQWAFNGPLQKRFENEFAHMQGLDHARCVTNGTIALQLACEALDLGPGDEVLVPGLTWQATASAVLDVNALPVLIDVNPETWCLDPDAAAEAITERTKAIIAVHLYCSMPELKRLRALTDDAGIALIEDCAHAHGARRGGEGAGSVGVLSCFSFQSSKTLTAGEGGCVATSDPDLADRLESLRNCSRPPAQPVGSSQPVHGGNHRITEWQAGVLLGQLERFTEQRERRERCAVAWRARLERTSYLAALPVPADVEHPPGYAFATALRTDAVAGHLAGRVPPCIVR